jgi:predicted membrane chloride channel (bestrophin family)
MAALLFVVVITPFQVCQLVNHDVVAPGLVFLSVWTAAALNEVARMLEEPFMNDHNDVPLADLHFDYNEKLLLLDNAAAWIAAGGTAILHRHRPALAAVSAGSAP